MKEAFWKERWNNGQIGFHQSDINPFLQTHYEQLQLAKDDTIFVPLCGKSLDMLWLAQKGLNVNGIEFSDVAVNDFYTENNINFVADDTDNFKHYKSDDVSLLCGDFFAMEQDHFTNVNAVFDRAALIALPPEMRARYVVHLAKHLTVGVRVLLITMEYPDGMISGPPFSVPEDEVKRLYCDNFGVELLESARNKAMGKKLKEGGDGFVTERVWLMTRK